MCLLKCQQASDQAAGTMNLSKVALQCGTQTEIDNGDGPMVLGQENCVVGTALNLRGIDSSLGPFPPGFGPAS